MMTKLSLTLLTALVPAACGALPFWRLNRQTSQVRAGLLCVTSGFLNVTNFTFAQRGHFAVGLFQHAGCFVRGWQMPQPRWAHNRRVPQAG